MISRCSVRECRATSFDHMRMGNSSRAGKLTLNAPRLFSQDCGGKFVNAVPRWEIRRGPVLSADFREPLGPLRTGGRNFSSGIDLATHVPAPTNVSRYPSAHNCSYALKTGIREIFSSAARSLVEGTR